MCCVWLLRTQRHVTIKRLLQHSCKVTGHSFTEGCAWTTQGSRCSRVAPRRQDLLSVSVLGVLIGPSSASTGCPSRANTVNLISTWYGMNSFKHLTWIWNSLENTRHDTFQVIHFCVWVIYQFDQIFVCCLYRWDTDEPILKTSWKWNLEIRTYLEL